MKDFLNTLVLFTITALLVAFACRVDAADMTVRWTPPTQNTDGSAIPATGPGSLTGHRIEWGTCNGTAFGTSAGTAVAPVPATSYVVTGLTPGTWCARAFARNTYGAESAESNIGTKVIAIPVPQPPVVSIATTAYELRMYRGGAMRFVAVGTVPLNAPCGERLADGFYTFDGATITKPTKGGVIAAKCAASSG